MFASGIRHWLFVAACLPLCGCIGGEIVSYTRYDAAADSFSRLELYVNIETSKEAELDHVALLYERRDRLVLSVLPAFNLFSSPVLLERSGKNRYREWPVSAAVAKEPDWLTTAVDLDSIENVPGEFFLNEYGNLCYYHQATIPGAAVDAAIGEWVPKIAAELAEFAREQQRLSMKKDARKPSWSQVRESLRESLEHDAPERRDQSEHGRLPRNSTSPCRVDPPGADVLSEDALVFVTIGLPVSVPSDSRAGKVRDDGNSDDRQERLPLDSVSLRLLARASEDGLVRLTRKADVFALLVPLSDPDCTEVIATVELARTVIAERQAAGKPVDEELADVLKAAELRHVAGSGLQVAIHGGAVWDRAACRRSAMPQPSDGKEESYRGTIAAIRQRGIAVNETDLFPSILSRFRGAGEPR